MTKSCVLCSILALMTVLSIAPAVLLFWVWQSSSRGLFGSFLYYAVLPGHFRTAATLIMLAPVIVLPAYALAFVSCHKRRDVLDRLDRAPG